MINTNAKWNSACWEKGEKRKTANCSSMKGELWRLVSVVALWLSGLWQLWSDTLGSSPAVARFLLFSFLPAG